MIWIAVRSSTVRDANGGFPVRRAGGAGHHRPQGGRGAPEASDRRAQSSREEHAGDRAVAGHADRARNRFAGSVSPGVRGPADRAQPGARSAHPPALEERRPARHRRRRDRALSDRARTTRSRSRATAITVTPRVALTLALAMHELTTNAAKYGALSVPSGRIAVRWRVLRRPSRSPLLRIEWRERGGPPVVRPDAARFRLALHRGQRRQPNCRARRGWTSMPPGCAARWKFRSNPRCWRSRSAPRDIGTLALAARRASL